MAPRPPEAELPFNWVLPVGEAVRDMMMEAGRWTRGSGRLPLCLHGPTPDHAHAHYIAEDADADGRIDHILVFAPGGLDRIALRLLVCADRLVVPRGGSFELEPTWMGSAMSDGLFGPARVWVTRSPYVPPWHRQVLSEQILKEIALRGLPAPLPNEDGVATFSQAMLGGREIRPTDFHLVRADGERPPADGRAAFVRLTFAEPVTGPIMLGFGCHFGLGQFAPEA
ncbi:MAG: type I-G CRISPR-associated protein Csb2 [Hyphomicrobiaceae bacterium]